MKNAVLGVIICTLLFCAACGGSSETCDFEISSFTNGENAESATSYWSCQAGNTTYGLAFYDDGTGFSTSNVGVFTWDETGCREVHASSAVGGISITEIEGSIASGIATFKQVFDESGEELDNSCALIEGGAAQLMGGYDFESEMENLLDYFEKSSQDD